MRRLGPDEEALWAKVIASVRPLHAPSPAPPAPPVEAGQTPPPAAQTPGARRPRPAPPLARPRPGTTLDSSWDKRLARGQAPPDVTVDLHGQDLAGAYTLLDESLDRAVSSGARLMLLITGKPPKGEPPVARGRIRAAVGDWLAASPHAGNIAAVRGAHPRHGGPGALYIVLRRRRQDTKW